MEKKAHQIKCENCGSSIDPSKMFCEHCGAKLFVTPSVGVKQKAVLTDEMLKTMLKANLPKGSLLPVVIFMVVWCSAAFFGSFMAFSYGIIPPGIISLLMGAFGATVLISQIKLSKNTNFEEIYSLYDLKNYKKASELLEEKLKNTNNFSAKNVLLTQLVILNYYIFNNIEKTKEYVLAMQALDYNNLPQVIKRVADELQM